MARWLSKCSIEYWLDIYTTIGKYVGEFETTAEKERRIRLGKDGYFIHSCLRYTSLKAVKKIIAHQEIFTDYNTDYVYNQVPAIHLTGDSLDATLEANGF